MKRRKFIQNSLLAGSAIAAYPYLNACKSAVPAGTTLAKRPLGKTGEKLSIIGFGGIVVDRVPQPDANNYVSEAFDKGVNYYDVAPAYGEAEEILGPALEPYRKDSFLACKTGEREAQGAEEELHASLKKLKTDYFDLYQLHAVSGVEEVETAFGPGGCMEVFLKAREQGKIRFLGFSAHSQEAALLLMEKFDFDTILAPINYVCWHQGNFGPAMVEKAKEKGMGILALKGMAQTRIPEGEEGPNDRMWYIPIEDDGTTDLSLRYTLSLGATAAIPPGDIRYFRRGMDIGLNYSEITGEETKKLIAMSDGVEPLFYG